jgi:outer membrane protein assembly factor BamE (lipoprotein component of BamABCDE complex)
MNNIKIFSNFLFILLITISCVEKPSYSGKILDNSIDFNTITSKNELLEKLGQPSFIDPVENKYFYHSEKKITKNFYNKKTSYMNIIVFSFDQNDKVLNFNKFEIDQTKKYKKIKDKTENNIVERGLIEKIFGGIGKTSIPNAP